MDEVRCICGLTHDDGFTIQCDSCMVWQHVICVNLTKNTVPDRYFCDQCHPRPLDSIKARQIQLLRLRNLKKDKEEKKRKSIIQGDAVKNRKDSLNEKLRGKVSLREKDNRKEHASPVKRLLPEREAANSQFMNGYSYLENAPPILKKSTSALNSPEIRKKKIKAEQAPRPDHVFEHEYSKFYLKNQKATVNRQAPIVGLSSFINSRLQYWHSQKLSYKFDHYTLKPLLSSDESAIDNLIESSKPVVVPSSILDIVAGNTVVEAVSKSADTNISEYGLFATTDIPRHSIIGEIKGTLTTINNLNQTEIQLKNMNGVSLLPPYIHVANLLTFSNDSITQLAVDSQAYGAFDARFARGLCCDDGDVFPNALLRFAYITYPSDRETITDISLGNEPVYQSERFRLILVATNDISESTEIKLKNEPGFLSYPCACSQAKCKVLSFVHDYDDLEPKVFADPSLDVFDGSKVEELIMVNPTKRPQPQEFSVSDQADGILSMKKIKVEPETKSEPVHEPSTVQPLKLQPPKKVLSLKDFMKKKRGLSGPTENTCDPLTQPHHNLDQDETSNKY